MARIMKPATKAGFLAIRPPTRFEKVGISDLLFQALLGQKILVPIMATSAGARVKAASIITATQMTRPGALEEKRPNFAKNRAENEVKTTRAAESMAVPA